VDIEDSTCCEVRIARSADGEGKGRKKKTKEDSVLRPAEGKREKKGEDDPATEGAFVLLFQLRESQGKRVGRAILGAPPLPQGGGRGKGNSLPLPFDRRIAWRQEKKKRGESTPRLIFALIWGKRKKGGGHLQHLSFAADAEAIAAGKEKRQARMCVTILLQLSPKPEGKKGKGVASSALRRKVAAEGGGGKKQLDSRRIF